MARSVSGEEHFGKFESIVTRFLDVNLTFAGHLPLSERMRRSVVSRRPISMDQPDLPESSLNADFKICLNFSANTQGGVRFFSSGVNLELQS